MTLRLAPGLEVPLEEAPRLRDRLFAGVDRGPGCWLWRGYRRNQYGHGAISVHDQAVYVHRLAWILEAGNIMDGLFVCHACDVPSCIRFDHLFLGTDVDNIADMRRKGRGSNPPRICGERHHLVTISDEQVAEIRRRWAACPRDQRGLAREYGVRQSTIWRIVNGVSR